MNKILLLISAIVSISNASGITVGGYVPLKSNINCVQENLGNVDPSKEILLMRCVLNNNAEEFTIRFVFGDYDVNDVRMEGENMNQYIGSNPGDFIWSPGPQKVATVDYEIRFYGKVVSSNGIFLKYSTIISSL